MTDFSTPEAASQVDTAEWRLRYAADSLGIRRRFAGRRIFNAEEIERIREWLDAKKQKKAEKVSA